MATIRQAQQSVNSKLRINPRTGIAERAGPAVTPKKSIGKIRGATGGVLGVDLLQGAVRGINKQNERSVADIQERGGFASSAAIDTIQKTNLLPDKLVNFGRGLGAGAAAVVRGKGGAVDAFRKEFNESDRFAPNAVAANTVAGNTVTEPKAQDALSKLEADLAGADIETLRENPPGQILESEEGGRVRSIRDAQGGAGTISAESPEALERIRGQVSERFPGATGDGGAGSFNTIPAEALIRGDTAERVSAAALAAARRGENISDIQDVVDKDRGTGAGATEANIASLENRLVKLNPKSAAFKTLSANVKSLRSQQKDARKEANAAQRFEARMQFDANKFLAGQQVDATKAEKTAADNEMKTIRTRVASFAKDQFPDDPDQQVFFEANQLEQRIPGGFYHTAEGGIVRQRLKDIIVEEVNDDERGLYDFFFGGDPVSDAELANLDFADWAIDRDGGNFPSIPGVGNDVIRSRTNPSNFAYLDNLPSEAVALLEQITEVDKEQPKQSLRTGQ